jgi:hypothetical protein
MNEQLIKKIQLASPIDKEEQLLWKEASDDAIKEGKVEPLSLSGLCKVIDQIAYQVATEAYDFVQSFPDRKEITEEDLLAETSDDLQRLGTIHFTAALASGIHPSIIYDLVDLRMDYYADEYIRLSGS